MASGDNNGYFGKEGISVNQNILNNCLKDFQHSVDLMFDATNSREILCYIHALQRQSDKKLSTSYPLM